MRAIVRFTIAQVRPSDADVLVQLHVARGVPISPRLRRLLDEARRLFGELVAPIAVMEDISREEFPRIYAGEGRNAPVTPLEGIAALSDRIALFAGTLGPAIDADVRERFGEGDAALGCVLDAFASCAASRVADLTARAFLQSADGSPAHSALPYSPGYCGWDVTGQRSLFARVRPEEIGVVLNRSCLMQPIKSVSGAIVVGHSEIHRFDPEFPFCSTCITRECRRRMRAAAKARGLWTS
jgi:hypothetical protein